MFAYRRLLRLWKAFGKDEDDLRRGSNGRNSDLSDASSWTGITISSGRVTVVNWSNLGLAGAVPAEVGALSALTVLWLFNNELSGLLPEKLGDLMR